MLLDHMHALASGAPLCTPEARERHRGFAATEARAAPGWSAAIQDGAVRSSQRLATPLLAHGPDRRADTGAPDRLAAMLLERGAEGVEDRAGRAHPDRSLAPVPAGYPGDRHHRAVVVFDAASSVAEPVIEAALNVLARSI